MLAKNILKYLFVVLPCILIAKSYLDCYYTQDWTFIYFYECFISHIPYIGQFVFNNIWPSNSLTMDIIELHQMSSKYLISGGFGAIIGNGLYEQFYDYILKMETASGSGTGSNQNPGNSSGPNKNPEGGGYSGSDQPAPVQPGGGFTFVNGRYHITDTAGIAARGYLNPATNQPWPSSQPYLGNLLAALVDNAARAGRPVVSLRGTHWEPAEWQFLSEYMQHNYPNRAEWHWWNSNAIREAIRRER